MLTKRNARYDPARPIRFRCQERWGVDVGLLMGLGLTLLVWGPRDATAQAPKARDAPPQRPSAAPGKAAPPKAAPPKTVPRKAGAAPQLAGPYDGLDHTGTPPLPPRKDRLPPQSGASGKRRKVPAYDGRKPARLTAGQVLIWIPRVLFFPVHLTLEYLLRWPIVQLITVLEKYYVIERVKKVFSFADGKVVWLPTFLKEFGQFSQVGLFVKIKDVGGVPGHSLILQAAFWTGHWYHAKAIDQFKVFRNNRGTVKIRGEFKYRPDSVFYGLGPDSVKDAKSFYRIRHTEVELSLNAVLVGLSRFRAGLFYRNVEITNGKSPAVVSLETAPYFWPDFEANVPGFNETYNLLTTQFRLDLDTRSPEKIDTPGSGLRMELLGSYSIDPDSFGDNKLPLHFAQWSGEVAGFWDVTGRNHVLSLRAYVAAQERIGKKQLPIHERLKLGGKEYLRGFISGRFRGDSAFVLSAQYRYPIWWMLDASLFVSMGNVFTGRFEDFSFRRMVLSWGIGVRTNTSKNVSFDVLVAFGSNQLGAWDEKFELDNIRLLIGVNQGF